MRKPAKATKVVARNHALANSNDRWPKGRGFPFNSVSWAVVVISGITVSLCMAAAATDVLQGNVRVQQSQRAVDQSPQGSAQSATAILGTSGNLVSKYGAVANSSTVAAAIKKAEAAGGQNVDRAVGAKFAADRDEALAHGYMLPGTDSTTALMYGLVPPGMSQEQASILSKGLPRLPRAASTGLLMPDMADRTAGLPQDPTSVLPQAPGRYEADTANQKVLEGYTRGRFGPMYVPPMHRNHNVAPSASKMSGDAPRSLDNQMSLISAQYNYDGGTGPTSIREMTDSSGNVVSQYGYDPYGRQIRIGGTGPDADFGYAGYYVHERSGLNLATYRAYSPIMGRWLNRDPIQDPTFAMAARSPEQALPSAIAMVPTNDVMPRITSLLQAATAQASTDSPNSYTYVANNPIRWSDPSGLYVNQVISLPGPVIPLKGPKPPGDPPEDPEDEWNFCSKLCAKYSGKAWEECMFACLGGKKHCGTK